MRGFKGAKMTVTRILLRSLLLLPEDLHVRCLPDYLYVYAIPVDMPVQVWR